MWVGAGAAGKPGADGKVGPAGPAGAAGKDGEAYALVWHAQLMDAAWVVMNGSGAALTAR